MKLLVITALIAVCGAAKLDRTYLPPPSAGTAGGSPGSLQTPLTRTSDQGSNDVNKELPAGSYTNNFQGVVVDAAAAGTRTSADAEQSGLGGPRPSYGSTASKVGEAAFKGSVAGFRNTQSFGSGDATTSFGSIGASGVAQGFENKSERPQAANDRNSNIVTYANDVNLDQYSYGFETDNGIAVGENGVANNGIQAQGGYSYKGDDGQVYKVTYTADEGGYRPQGDHLPTPPPIPQEILASLEQNAKEEAAGLVDDGSYDAQKYNMEGDYTHNNDGDTQYNGAQLSQFTKRPESDATASSSFINQNNQAFGKPGSGQFGNNGEQNIHSNSFNTQSNQINGNKFGSRPASANNHNGLALQQSQSSQPSSGSQGSSSGLNSFGQTGSQLNSQFGQGQGNFGSHSAQFGSQVSLGSAAQFGSQANKQGSTEFGGQSSQFGTQNNKQGSAPQFGSQLSQIGQGQDSFGSQSTQFGSQVSHGSAAKFGSDTNKQGSTEFGGQSSQFGTQYNKQGSANQFGSQSAQFGSQASQGSAAQFNSEANKQGITEFGGQSSQFGTQENKQGSVPQFGSQPSQTNQGLGDFGSQSAQFGSKGNQRPAAQFGIGANKQGSTEFGSQPSQIGSQSHQQGSTAQFGSQPAQSHFGIQPSKPLFGQPAVNSESNQATQFQNQGQSQVLHNQFSTQSLNKPGFSNSGFNKPSSSGQSNTAALSSNSNGFSHKPNGFGSGNGIASTSQNLNGQVLQGHNKGSTQSSSASAFTSVGLPSNLLQPAKPLNHIQPESSGQFNYNSDSQLASQGDSQLNDLPSYSQQFDVTSTLVPQTELTTPLEPNGKPTSSQGSQFNGQSRPSFGSFDAQSLNNQAQSQFGSFGNVAGTQQSTGSQFGSSFPTQAAVPALNNGKPQSPQSSFTQQQTPSFGQGVDHSYYYSQPSKPFSTPGPYPQGSRFPASPSYQSNGVGSSSQNNQFFTQHSSLSSTTKFPGSPSFASAAPTSSTQFAQGSQSNKNYNGITQAAISPFPSVSPTKTPQLDTTASQADQFRPKPTLNQPLTSFVSQSPTSESSSRPTIPQQSFPLKPITQFSHKPSTYIGHSQTQLGQDSLTSNDKPENLFGSNQNEQSVLTQQHEGTIYEYNKPADTLSSNKPETSQPSSKPSRPIIPQQSYPSKPATQFGLKPATAFAQSQNQFGQNLLSSNIKPVSQESSKEQQNVSTQQYQGTIYEYNKPADTLPTPEQTGTSSSQSAQSQGSQLTSTAESKPQLGSQIQSQFGQSSFSAQSQQSNLNKGIQGSVPQFGIEALQPLDSIPSNPSFGQPTVQTTQFTQNTQAFTPQQGLASLEQPTKPFSIATNPSTSGQSTQQGSLQSQQNTQGSQISAQPLKPFGFTQFAQNTQTSFGSQTSQQPILGAQFGVQPAKPAFGSAFPSQFGQNTQQAQGSTSGFNTQGSQYGAQPFKPFETTGLTQGTNKQPFKPFGTGATQVTQGSKPQYNSPQTTQTQFTQSTQQNFGNTQTTSSAAPGAQFDAPSKPFGNSPSINDHPDSQKSQFGQNTQTSGPAFGHNSFHGSQTQFGSKLQFGAQNQFGQNQNVSPTKPFGSASSQTQFSQTSAHAESSSSQQSQGPQGYKPFGASSQKPEFTQVQHSNAEQSQSTQNSQSGAQSFKPFGSSGTQGQKPHPCCQGSKDSSIGAANIGKPSQAFAQTQSQFTGFQGTQTSNVQSVSGKGEQFGGPRQPPSFDDKTGYHY